jgi:hypothetical protein
MPHGRLLKRIKIDLMVQQETLRKVIFNASSQLLGPRPDQVKLMMFYSNLLDKIGSEEDIEVVIKELNLIYSRSYNELMLYIR